MADFRKWLLVLAVVVFAVSASAQTTCSVTPAQPPVLRDGGLTELVGDVVLSCNVPAPTTVNFQVFMTVPVTSDFTRSVPGIIVNRATAKAGVPTTTALTNNSVQFLGVVLPAGTATEVRITNIRVSAPPASSTGFVPTQVQEYVSTDIVPITNPVQTVGYVQPAFTFSVTDCAGAPATNTIATFQQCIARPTGNELHFGVKFTEVFATAFKNRGSAAQTDAAVGYNTESGRTFPAGTPVISDVAETGTRLIVRFANVPSGVTINVTGQNTAIAGVTPAGFANLVGGTVDINGVGGTAMSDFSGGTDAQCGESAPVKVFPTKKSGTTAYAVWEVVNAQDNVRDQVVFGVQVAYTTVSSPVTPGQVTGVLGPQFDPTTAATAEDFPYPSFNGGAQTGNTPFQIVPCVTNLLFPYVTAQQGYTTGIALVNTSKDNATGSTGTPKNAPFNTAEQHGACHLYFFGNQDVAPQTTADVPAGSLVKFTLTDVPSGWPSLADFEGYIIARCDFQFAHGFAFIVDGTVPGFGSEAYLAMVIPDRGANGRTADPFDAGPGAGAGTGEQLLH